MLLRTDGLGAFSAADPITTVTTMAHPELVDTVLVGGQFRKRAGRLVGLDEDVTRALVGDSRRRLDAAVLVDAQIGMRLDPGAEYVAPLPV